MIQGILRQLETGAAPASVRPLDVAARVLCRMDGEDPAELMDGRDSTSYHEQAAAVLGALAEYVEAGSEPVCVSLDAATLAFIARWRGPFGEAYTPRQALELLADDLRLADARPGSWEGSGMLSLLISHGIRPAGDDACDW